MDCGHLSATTTNYNKVVKIFYSVNFNVRQKDKVSKLVVSCSLKILKINQAPHLKYLNYL